MQDIYVPKIFPSDCRLFPQVAILQKIALDSMFFSSLAVYNDNYKEKIRDIPGRKNFTSNL